MMTPEEHALIVRARHMRVEGRSWTYINQTLGKGAEWAQRRLEPRYAEKRRQQVKDSQKRGGYRYQKPGRHHVINNPEDEVELVQVARRMRAEGVGWPAVSRKINRSTDWIKRRLDPSYRERRNEQKRIFERNAGNAPRAVRQRLNNDAAKRMAEIPDDTRDLTARFFGDPLPGRSALDKRGLMAAHSRFNDA